MNEARRAGRIAHNRAFIDGVSAEHGIELLCECGDLDCGRTLVLSPVRYLELRARNQPAISPTCPYADEDGVSTG
jgi:hypothetical protein